MKKITLIISTVLIPFVLLAHEIKKNISEKYALGEEEIDYFFISGEITNSTYKLNDSWDIVNYVQELFDILEMKAKKRSVSLSIDNHE
ncbi:hypothetical protein N9Y89_01790 [bacterium]|nr:hypothetical protein [bacterium]